MIPEKAEDSVQSTNTTLSNGEAEQFSHSCAGIEVSCLQSFSDLLHDPEMFPGPEWVRRGELISLSFDSRIKIPRDGNCFYRSIALGLLQQRDSPHVKHKFLDACKRSQEILVSKGYSDYTLEDFFSYANDFATQLWDSDTPLWQLFHEQMQPEPANYLVIFLKLVVSAHIQNNEMYYANFVQEHSTVASFCQRDIEPLGRFTGELEVSAVAESLGLKVRVYSVIPCTAEFVDYPSDDTPPQISLLYSPGHYELLVKNKASLEAPSTS